MKVVSVSRVVTCISFLRTITSTLVAIITLYVFHILLYEIFPLGITPVTEVCDPSTLPSVSAVTTMHRSNYKIPSLPVPKEKCFTVLLLTSNRTNLLLRCLRHYASMNSIHKIIITWNNQHTEPPDFQGMIDFKVPVVIKVQTENKLRLRFNAYDDIETEGRCQRLSSFLTSPSSNFYPRNCHLSFTHNSLPVPLLYPLVYPSLFSFLKLPLHCPLWKFSATSILTSV